MSQNSGFYRFIFLLSCCFCVEDASAQKQSNKPNIIFILTDDHRAGALGYTGNKYAHTPEMDKLAQTGVYFKKALVTTPICAASRASILCAMQERAHRYTFQTAISNRNTWKMPTPKY